LYGLCRAGIWTIHKVRGKSGESESKRHELVGKKKKVGGPGSSASWVLKTGTPPPADTGKWCTCVKKPKAEKELGGGLFRGGNQGSNRHAMLGSSRSRPPLAKNQPRGKSPKVEKKKHPRLSSRRRTGTGVLIRGSRTESGMCRVTLERKSPTGKPSRNHSRGDEGRRGAQPHEVR